MAAWLLKTEPDDYNWDKLSKDGRTIWDGVANATALIHIRSMRKGDLALIYHTGQQRQAVGIATIISDPYPDPALADPKRAVVDIKIQRALERPVTLAQIKADKAFAGWDLLRIGRLSVVPTPPALWKRIITLSESKGK